MFLPLFHNLRALKVPVSLTEWLALMEALKQGLHNDSIADFYYLSRSLLVKDVAYYDAFEEAFTRFLQNDAIPMDLLFDKDEILQWLQEPHSTLHLSPRDLQRMESLTLEELFRDLEDRLKKQEEPHQGGNQWVGTGGTSPFGAAGSNPSGISFGSQRGRGQAALVGVGRKYRNLRNDLTIDVRQMGVALKRLRDLRECGEETLDLPETIDKSCRNAGEIDLVFTRERENQVRLILLMDSGGSMEPYRRLSEQLFSAAHGLNHFKDFRAFYFHNCIYENLYTDLQKDEFVPTAEVIKEYGKRYRLIVVGDAAMSPHELTARHGTLEHYVSSELRGVDWLRELSLAFPKRAWLNPISEDAWVHFETVPTVEALFPMYPLTLEGLSLAVRRLH